MGLDLLSLHVGQAVTIRELNYGVQIDPPLESETGLTVLAVTPEHLVLGDADGGTRSIPVYLIHKPAKPASTGVTSAEAA